MRTKIEPGDIAAYEWAWERKFGEGFIEDLMEAYGRILANAAPEMSPGVVQQLAGAYANFTGPEAIKGMELETKRRMGMLVEQSIREGEGIGALQRRIRTDFSFSRQRATLIARTETAKALGQGQKAAAIFQGRDEKRWMTQGDDLVRDEHVRNGAAGWIGVGDSFPSGEDTVGEPNCRCNVVYRTRALHDEPVTDGVRHRCPKCRSTLEVNKDGPGGWCRRCKKVIEG